MADGSGMRLFQIDDGYQTAWGDWLSVDPRKFPGGAAELQALARRIAAAGLIPGIWLAPFACDKGSAVARAHFDWVLKRGGGRPANSGNCGKFFYGLDATNAAVQEHVRSHIRTITRDWGFRYLKLDFLYAAALEGAQESFQHRGLTRAQAMQRGMEAVTAACRPPEDDARAGDVFVLGCGAPLGAVLGHVHGNRISPDAGLSWLPEFPLPRGDKWNLPSARSMLRNTLVRLPMHGRWWINDPDCLLLRIKGTRFSGPEARALASAKAMSGGAFVVSDDLARVPATRRRWLCQCTPATGVAAVPVDLLEREMPEVLRLGWTGVALENPGFTPRASAAERAGAVLAATVAVCNWGDDVDKRHSLQPGHVFGAAAVEAARARGGGAAGCLHLLSFWDEAYERLEMGLADDGYVALPFTLEPHSCAILAARWQPRPDRAAAAGAGAGAPAPLAPAEPIYIGSNLHFSCYLEVTSFRVAGALSPHALNSCTITFREGAVREEAWGGWVWVFLPPAEGLEATGSAASPQRSIQVVSAQAAGSVYKVPVARASDTAAASLVLSWFAPDVASVDVDPA